jgi:copper chaperone CopZ
MSRWLVVIALAACSKSEPAAPVIERAPAVATPKVAPPRPAELTKVTIKAIGMYCEESCPLKVRYALADVPAVYELGFDVSNESIFVSYDRSLGTPKEVTKPMLVAIKGAGFDPWLAKETWPEGAKADVVPR